MNLLRRENIMSLLQSSKDKPVIKVLTGVRRSGKSTALKMFANELVKSRIGKQQIQQYNFEDPKVNVITNWREHYDIINSNLVNEKMNYIFIDEVQELNEFQKLLNGLQIIENADLYITGSNARLLSGELATLLSGRYITINVTPFSCREFSEFNKKIGYRNLIESYISGSGFPAIAGEEIQDSDFANAYIKNIYSTVLEKDIFQRLEIRDKRDFQNIAKFVFANIGSPLSPNNISNKLTSSGIKINNKTVERYIKALIDSYLIYEVNRFDVKGKKQLATQEKYYAVDLGIRRYLIGQKRRDDIGHCLENVVYFELLRRGGKIWTGKSQDSEIDFVVQKPMGEIEYYQVAYTAKDESTLARELSPLKKIKDNYRKFLLTTDEFEFNNDGIELLNIERWVLGG
ncbi:MAG: ATP-binding protein [Fibromonadaceae bacterium]|jgi:predicted AAA+ superfamily ATPase|nr:ATP-binding protein [Fibromonadaceae bacterium]